MIWPAVVLAVATAILQSHAIPYWVGQAGPWGWLWAPGAELLAWWFLSRPGVSARMVGVVAAAVVVGGPVVQLAAPAIADMRAESHQTETLESRIQTLRKDVAAATQRAEDHRQQAADLQHYSDGRHQRQVELAQQAEQRATSLRQRRQDLQAKLAEQGRVSLAGMEVLNLGLHVGILLVAWLGSMSAVSTLSRPVSGRLEPDASDSAAVDGTVEAPPHIRELRGRVKAAIDASGMGQTQWARSHTINPRDVSLLMNWETASRHPSEAALGAIEAAAQAGGQ